jgi:hypothetical protein
MMTSGFTLCDDLMGLIGERVKANRDQDTMDYWCELPSPSDERSGACAACDGTGVGPKREMLETMEELIETLDGTTDVARAVRYRAQTMMESLSCSVLFRSGMYMYEHGGEVGRGLEGFDDPEFWETCEAIPAFLMGTHCRVRCVRDRFL